MSTLVPLLATEQTAARLCDMCVSEFRQLVLEGHLPKAREIAPGLYRWPVDDLNRIVSGAAAYGEELIKW